MNHRDEHRLFEAGLKYGHTNAIRRLERQCRHIQHQMNKEGRDKVLAVIDKANKAYASKFHPHYK